MASSNPWVCLYWLVTDRTVGPHAGDSAAADAISLQVVDHLRQQQALSLSLFDVFFVFALVAAGLIALALLMRRSVAEKGAHLAAE